MIGRSQENRRITLINLSELFDLWVEHFAEIDDARRFHALRHSAATIMLAAGTPLEVISKILGHTGYAITADIYAKVGDELQRGAARNMDRELANP